MRLHQGKIREFCFLEMLGTLKYEIKSLVKKDKKLILALQLICSKNVSCKGIAFFLTKSNKMKGLGLPTSKKDFLVNKIIKNNNT